jgi:hypothetical protein
MRSPIPLALPLLIVFIGAAQAHDGYGGYKANRYGGEPEHDYDLQGEDYDTPAGCSDPDSDGEHTKPVGTSPTGFAFLPNDGCSIVYDAVPFEGCGYFWYVDARVGGQSAPMTYTINVLVDGKPHDSVTFTQSASDGMKTWAFSGSTAVILSGAHRVEIGYTVDDGPYWANLELDASYIRHTTSDACNDPAGPATQALGFLCAALVSANC